MSPLSVHDPSAAVAGTPTDAGPDAPARVLPVLSAEPPTGSVADWTAQRREEIHALVTEYGAVLLRGLGVGSPAEVAEAAEALGIERMTERERFAPRRSHAPGVYTSSEWPADEPMCMHHELSYAAEVPGLVLFGCLTAPASGGLTQVADSQQVLRMLPPELVERFERGGWLLTRMYHDVGVPWQEAFGTEDRAAVDAYCAAAGLDHEWLPDGRLRTRQRRAAVLPHPRDGVPVWFNQAAFLNEQTMDPVIRDYLVDVYGPDGLPFNTAYGDGAPLTAETVQTINAAYRAASIGEPWQSGDLLLVDNLRMAHSRDPYEGDRDIVVILGNPVRLAGHVLS
ncbi:TauD/TfdA family dioxygenase [Streptomyces sp. NPDC014734]|uniref:TauD/TfdA family dioxygenase n=1 Tax=Streptomyces sp. NPDC014734 TaxID=3364886 RepID=UPI0036FF6412